MPEINWQEKPLENLQHLAQWGTYSAKQKAREEIARRQDEDKMRRSEASNSLTLARFTLALDDVRQKIVNEILPAGAYLQCPDEELLQTLELAASAIEQYQRGYKLQAVPVKGGDAMK